MGSSSSQQKRVVERKLSQVWPHLLRSSLPLYLIGTSFGHTFHLIIMETLRHVWSLSPLRKEDKIPPGNHESLPGSEYSHTTYNMVFNHLLLVTELRNFSGIIQPAFTEWDYVPDAVLVTEDTWALHRIYLWNTYFEESNKYHLLKEVSRCMRKTQELRMTCGFGLCVIWPMCHISKLGPLPPRQSGQRWGAGIPPFHEEDETAFQRGTVTWNKKHSAYQIEFSCSKAVLLPRLIAFPKYKYKGLQTTAGCREQGLHNCLIDTEPEIPFGTFRTSENIGLERRLGKRGYKEKEKVKDCRSMSIRPMSFIFSVLLNMNAIDIHPRITVQINTCTLTKNSSSHVTFCGYTCCVYFLFISFKKMNTEHVLISLN